MLSLRTPLVGVIVVASVWLFGSLFWAFGSLDHTKGRFVNSELLKLSNLFDARNRTLGVRQAFPILF
jgi:hypothetical protein